ncbi:MAG: DUF4389 domain-containing protein [Rhodobacteraceae bacterium]|nr:DUF4389 domain-containing protein [Paracoccaceae bacterium]
MPDLPEPPQRTPEKIGENMGMRLLHSVILAVMINLAQSLLLFLTVVQFFLAIVNNNEPNRRIAEFGTDLGTWLARAARYQAMSTEDKPWPWGAWDE